MTWSVAVTDTAKAMLPKLSKRDQKSVVSRMHKLAHKPDHQEKSLSGDSSGYRRVRTGRLRIIYRTERNTNTVYIVVLGLRRAGDRSDVYEAAKKITR
ncbi:MAG: type II toxin-antitoxin system RelE/ParE family toxin [Dissulfuribacterales bacterium]